MDNIFRKILNDRTSGSTELLNKLIRYLYQRTKEGKSIGNEIEIAKKQLGHFAVINFQLKLISVLISKNDQQQLLSYLAFVTENEKNIYQRIFSSIPEVIKRNKKILTLSNSKTVFEILNRWYHYNSKLEVVILESQPECEGKYLTKKLIRSGIKSKVIPDSAISTNIEKSDLLLMGCDIILKNGDIVNKTGSRDAAIIANYFNKPVLVVSSKSKQTKKSMINIRGRNKSEMYLFERVEKKLISYLVTD